MAETYAEFELTPSDLARVRFAFSPTSEAVASLRVLQEPSRYAVHLPWLRAVRPRLAGLDLGLLLALVPLGPYYADFLTPSPSGPLPDVKAELREIASTSPEEVAAEASRLPKSSVLQQVLRDPTAWARRAADDLAAYWEIAVAPYWPQIRGLLEAEVLRRSRQLARDGAAAMFNDLHERITWQDGTLRVRTDAWERRGPLVGDGIMLVPSVFRWPSTTIMAEPYEPKLGYPAPGVGTVWSHDVIPTPDALDSLLGRTRARILVTLDEPTTTTVLARRLDLRPGAVSQHLKVLTANGLLTRRRVGREVYYTRTAVGDALSA